jgi:predicted enzyme related to lactoylglutathione lyase
MTAVGSIWIINVPVSDQDRALAFYRDVLGFEVFADNQVADGMRWLMVHPPDQHVHLVLSNWHDDVEPGSLRNNFLYVDDLDAAIETLEGRGVEFERIDRGTPFGSFAPFRDPDGNEWALLQPQPVPTG